MPVAVDSSLMAMLVTTGEVLTTPNVRVAMEIVMNAL